MIEPFEYEKTRSEPRIRENVTDGGLDTSLLDRPLKKLNHFDPTPEFERYLAEQEPFSKAHRERVGRVEPRENKKGDFQSEAIGQLGSMNSGYDVTPFGDLESRPNASVLIGNYLDRTVSFVPEMVNTVESVQNIKVDDPVLQPGISFIDSRKNMATRF
jgi:hypothetical protein